MLQISVHVVFALMMLQQIPRQRAPRQQSPELQGSNTDAVATFDGMFKSVDKKYLTIAVEEGQTIRMFITGSTKFVRDGMPAKSSDFQVDQKIRVEASRDARLNLIAVRVEAVTDKAPERQPSVN
jgi:hypothetical protein